MEETKNISLEDERKSRMAAHSRVVEQSLG